MVTTDPDALEEARQWARHGYEIGQKHCSWTDYGVAPAWLTEGWPPHIESCEFLRHAAGYDEALTRVREVIRHAAAHQSMEELTAALREALGGYLSPALDQ